MTTERVTIGAKPFWSRTGLQLLPGTTYQLSAEGRWKHWFVACTADGYSRWYLRLFAPVRRAPSEPWFRLMGSLDADPETIFPIGTRTTYSPQRAGELVCFANDVRWAYGNNSGQVELTVVSDPGPGERPT